MGVLKSFICGVAIKDVERKSPLATCTLERPFQSKHSSSKKYFSTPRSHLPLPSLSASPACALSIEIINFFVPRLTKVFYITSMRLAGEGLAITGYILSHSTASTSCFFAAKCYQLAMQHSVLGEKKKDYCILKYWLHQMATRLRDSNHAELRQLKTLLENWCLLSLHGKKWIKKENNKEGHTLIWLCSA